MSSEHDITDPMPRADASLAVTPIVAPAVEAEKPVSLKTFLLLNVLWLPLAVTAWAGMRSFIAFPLTRLARWGLDWWLPGVIESSRQYYQFFKFTALIPLPPGMVAEAGQVPAV